MPTLPYIHFQGTCAEALAFYAQVFNGSDLQLMRYREQPGAAAGWAESDLVMHGQINLGDGTLMASDFPPGQAGDPQTAVSIMQSAPDPATGRLWFDRLCAGGAVIHPFGETFFSPGFGMVKDRFGTHWIVSTTAAA